MFTLNCDEVGTIVGWTSSLKLSTNKIHNVVIRNIHTVWIQLIGNVHYYSCILRTKILNDRKTYLIRDKMDQYQHYLNSGLPSTGKAEFSKILVHFLIEPSHLVFCIDMSFIHSTIAADCVVLSTNYPQLNFIMN